MITSFAGRRVWIVSSLTGNNRRQRITDALMKAGCAEVRWIDGSKAKKSPFVPNDIVVFHSGVNSHSFQGPVRERARQVGATFVIDYALKPETISQGGVNPTAFPGVDRVPTGNQHVDTTEVPVASKPPHENPPVAEPPTSQVLSLTAAASQKVAGSRLEGVWKRLDQEMLDYVKACDEKKETVTAADLEKIFEISAQTISRRLKPLGVDFAARRHARKLERAKAVEKPKSDSDLDVLLSAIAELDERVRSVEQKVDRLLTLAGVAQK